MSCSITIQDVERALDKLAIPYLIDSKSTNIGLFKRETDKITIVTSNSAFKSYDDHHPERIVCFLFKSTNNQFLIVVKNRELDLEKYIKFWWNRDCIVNPKNINCVVCFTTKKNIGYMCCNQCYSLTCKKCHVNINGDNDATQCSVCRYWKLDGDAYGVPVSPDPDNKITCKTPNGKSVADQFVNLISQFDGNITIIPRINRSFMMDAIMEVCKLGWTDRYSDGSMRYKKIREKIEKICKKYTDIKLYTFRKTYHIDKIANKPVDEMSVFYLDLPNNHLQQMSKDSYINVFDEDRECIVVKTEYMVPFRPVIPGHIRIMFSEINHSYPYEKTISVITENHENHDNHEKHDNHISNHHNFNFDVDESGVITTIHVDMLAWCLSANLTFHDNQKIYVTCRIHKYEDKQKADFMCYTFSRRGYARINPSSAHDVFSSDIDGLKNSKDIQVFL